MESGRRRVLRLGGEQPTAADLLESSPSDTRCYEMRSHTDSDLSRSPRLTEALLSPNELEEGVSAAAPLPRILGASNSKLSPLLPSSSPAPTPRRHPSYGTAPPPSPPPPPSLRRRRELPKRKLRSKLLFLLITILLIICVYASFVDDFMGVVEAGISCGTCLGLLVPLQALAHMGDDAFVEFFVSFCTNLGIEDADVCAGAVGTQAPILAHDLRSISLASHAAKNFCSTVFGLCPLQDVIPYAVDVVPFRSEGELEVGVMRERKHERRWRSKGGKPFQVVHISDVHIDRSYLPGSNTVCSKNICCRDYGLGSVGPNISYPAGKFGNKHCDTPVDLVRSMLNAINRHVPNKSFSIFTGDVVESAVWATDQASVTNDLHLWSTEMQAPSYPVIGNHDVSPVNSFPRDTSPLATSAQWVFDLAERDWQKWIGRKAARQVASQSGCYAVVHPGTDLKIISINTQYWYKQNFWLYDSDLPQWDPNGILSWMASELHDAERLGQRAWIIGHMPFGKVDALRDQSNYAGQIFERYHRTIAAHFYGHSHVDEFEIAYPDYHDQRAETANGIAFISGALTPGSGNPVFRVYDVDPDTYEVVDFVPWYTNKTEPSFDIDPVWQPYYSARASYGDYIDPPLGPLDSLNATFWHRITEVMEKDEALFQLFNTRLSRGGKVEECSTTLCKSDTICMMRSMRSESNCAFIQPGFTFRDRKRDTESVTEPGREDTFLASSRHADYHACEGPGLGSMLRKLGSGVLDRNIVFETLLTFRSSARKSVEHHRRKEEGARGWLGRTL